MQILMVAPHPVYTPRGTPISVLNRCRALSALGHRVDLVTYPIGEDVPVSGLRYLRARVPGISRVNVGPSWAKIPLDVSVFATATKLLLRNLGTYDVLHTHEEAGAVGALLHLAVKIPHVYDMGNDWSVVLRNYGFSHHHPLTRLAHTMESRVVRNAQVVIVHFPELAERIHRDSPNTKTAVAFNVPFEPSPDRDRVAELRNAWSPDDRPIIVYAGTLEVYQGISLLLRAFALLRRQVPARLVIIGGTTEQIRELETESLALDLRKDVRLEGPMPQSEIPSCLAAADVLVSPRSSGTNTPLKVFSYMATGVPIVATRIASHTQVLSDATALLVDPDEEALARGLGRALNDRAAALRTAETARALAAEQYSHMSYVRSVAAAYTTVGGPVPDEAYITEAVRRLEVVVP